ncbi:MAG TPA: amidohydrolase family protein [Acidobacteriaceae bacterium]|nr:amidohydrolase family protein [Acidobacteriaceae bacterium]
MKKIMLLLCGLSAAMAWGAWAAAPAPQVSSSAISAIPPGPLTRLTPAELKAFRAFDPIDAHTHVYRHDPAFTGLLQQMNLHIVDIVVPDPADTASHRTLAQLRDQAWQAMAATQGRGRLSTAYDPFDWSSPGFPTDAIERLNQDFAHGAVASTMWNNPGMSIKDGGVPVLPDNNRLEPIYKDAAARHKTLIAHLTAADEGWEAEDRSALGEGPEPAPHSGDLAAPPLLRARDRIVQMNPNLRVIAVHLSSVKEGLDQIGRRLDLYPNLAIDTSLEVDPLMMLPRAQVRAFFLKYQDRILYGTDNSFRQLDDAKTIVAVWQNRYAVDWRYFSSGSSFEYRGHQVQGLGLPPAVLRKLYHDNAVHWIPGAGR